MWNFVFVCVVCVIRSMLLRNGVLYSWYYNAALRVNCHSSKKDCSVYVYVHILVVEYAYHYTLYVECIEIHSLLSRSIVFLFSASMLLNEFPFTVYACVL